MEVIGGHDAGVAVFVNAHHSIGIRGLLLFGTEEQKRRWLPPLVRGEQLGAFALTEPEAGSDASNVQTTATPTPDGQAYLLNGTKRYITNGAIAQVLTVMARTPGAGSDRKKEITAFLVTPDMPGFEVVEARMPKMGIRGTATARLAFHDMRVPKENILGQVGKGLQGGADRAGLRPDHLRRELHRGGEDLSASDGDARQAARAVPAADRRL